MLDKVMGQGEQVETDVALYRCALLLVDRRGIGAESYGQAKALSSPKASLFSSIHSEESASRTREHVMCSPGRTDRLG